MEQLLQFDMCLYASRLGVIFNNWLRRIQTKQHGGTQTNRKITTLFPKWSIEMEI